MSLQKQETNVALFQNLYQHMFDMDISYTSDKESCICYPE